MYRKKPNNTKESTQIQASGVQEILHSQWKDEY